MILAFFPWLCFLPFLFGIMRFCICGLFLRPSLIPSIRKNNNNSYLWHILLPLDAIFWGAGMAQWWEHSPPTDVARDRFSNLTQYVGWVCCWFSSLPREVFLRVLRFSPLLKNQHFQILIRSRFQWTNSHYVEVPLQISILFYSLHQAFCKWSRQKIA